MSTQRRVILASQSPQRQLLCRTLPIEFEAIPAHLDEKSIVDSDLVKRAEVIARAKVEEVATQYPEAVVFGADTYVIFNGQALEKPLDQAEARQMLRQQSGQKLQEVSGFCYIDAANNINFSTTVMTDFKFRELSAVEIETYVTTKPVTTWSAAFSPAYHEGMSFIAEVHGSFTGFTHGLPLEVLVPLLQKSQILTKV